MQKKALIVGIDGVPFGLITRMMEQGHMKELKHMCEGNYTIHKMHASYPDISSVSWTSFMTGANPAEHGIYGFTDLKPNSYDLYFPNSRDIKAPTFWQTLQKQKNKTGSCSEHPEYLPCLSHRWSSRIWIRCYRF